MESPTGTKDAEGMQVVRELVDALADRLGERLVSAYAIGSLAHGGFEPAVSDVDVAILVDACTADVPSVVAAAVAETRARLGAGLADRLSVFYGDWQTFARPVAPARLGAIDRLDLMQHGVLVHGVDRREADGRIPAHAELVEATAAFLAEKPLRRHEPGALVAAGARPLTKAVLFPVRFLHTLATGRAGSNEDAGRWYCGDGRPAAPLVSAALRWRCGDVPAEEAVRLVAMHLEDLQDECTTAFARG